MSVSVAGVATACGAARGARSGVGGPTSTQSTAGAHTAEISTTFAQTGQPSGTEIRVYDYDRHLGEILPGKDPAGDTQSAVILDGTTDYESLDDGSYAGIDLHGKEWIAEPENPDTRAEANFADPFDSPLPAGSAAALAKLAPLVTAISRVGATTIGGESVTEYRLTVSSAQMQVFMQDGVDFTDPNLHFNPVEMWIDSSDRIRRTHISFSEAGQGRGTITNDYSHYGDPVNVTIPPANKVITAAQLQKLECNAAKSIPTVVVGNATPSPPASLPNC